MPTKYVNNFGIYLITDGGRLRNEGRLSRILISLVQKFPCIVGVQIRERVYGSIYEPASFEYVHELVSSLKLHASSEDFFVTVNAEVDIALASGADGVHLGRNSISPFEARNILGNDRIVGYSAHSLEELIPFYAVESNREVLDYAYLSPVFKPGSKEYHGPVLGLDVFREVAEKSAVPLFALGGIRSQHVEDLHLAGASGIALISSVLYEKDPISAMEKFDNKIGNLPSPQYS